MLIWLWKGDIYEKNFRICLLIGLILSTILYAYYTISCFVGIIGVAGIMSGSGNVDDAVFQTAGIMTIGIMVVMIIFGILGLIFSSVSYNRVSMDPKKMAGKKGLPITVSVFNFILAVLILIGLTEGVDALSIICLIGFIASAVLIIIDIARNKTLLNKQNVQTPNNEIQESVKEEENK